MGEPRPPLTLTAKGTCVVASMSCWRTTGKPCPSSGGRWTQAPRCPSASRSARDRHLDPRIAAGVVRVRVHRVRTPAGNAYPSLGVTVIPTLPISAEWSITLQEYCSVSENFENAPLLFGPQASVHTGAVGTVVTCGPDGGAGGLEKTWTSPIWGEYTRVPELTWTRT